MRVLVHLAGYESDTCLLNYVKLLHRDVDLEVRLIRIIDENVVLGSVARLAESHKATTLVDEAIFSLDIEGICTTGAVHYARESRTAAVIVHEAERWQVDMIVMIAQGGPIWQRFFGRRLRRQVMQISNLPVASVSPPPPLSIKPAETRSNNSRIYGQH